MSFKKFNKNLLPLLAFTVLVLSVGVIRYNDTLVMSDKNTQSVLSESDEKDSEDERKTDEKSVEKEEEKKNEDSNEIKKETESRKESTVSVDKRDSIRTTEKPKVKLEIVKVEDSTEDEIEIENDEAEVSNEIEDEFESEFEQESETASADGTVNKFKLKLKTRTVAGKTIVETEAGEVEVENNPDEVINNLVSAGLLDNPTSFEAKTNNNSVEFEIQGTESKKFLGIIDVVIPKMLTISSETGEVVSMNQNVWSRILSLLSI